MGNAAAKREDGAQVIVATPEQLRQLIRAAVREELAANTNNEPTGKRTQYKCDEFAALLRKTPRTVVNMIKAGDIRASKVGREWRIPASEADRLLLKG